MDDEYLPAVDGKQIIELAVNGLYATLYKARPDVLMVVSGFFVPKAVYELCRAYGTRVVLVHTEEPYETDRAAQIAQWADINLVNDPTNIDAFPPNTRYVPHAYRPRVHFAGSGRDDYRCDFAFIGTGYPSRVRFMERMDLSGLDVILGGNWPTITDEHPLRKFIANDPEECVDNVETAEVYRSARIGMNLYRRESTEGGRADGWAMGPREVELAACGLFYLRDPRGEGDEVLDMLPTFSSPEEAGDLLRYWLKRPVERAELALKAKAAVADRTFANHAVDLLRHIESS